MQNKTEETGTKSTFVTVIAWICIGISGLGFLVSIVQMILVYTVLPMAEMSKSFQNPQLNQNMPDIAKFMFLSFRTVVTIFCAFSLLTLTASIGLLRRLNWARIFFIVMLALGIIWNIGGLVVQFNILSSLPGFPQNTSGFDAKIFFLVFKAISIFVAVAALSVLFGWVIKKLLSNEVKREFGLQRQVTE